MFGNIKLVKDSEVPDLGSAPNPMTGIFIRGRGDTEGPMGEVSGDKDWTSAFLSQGWPGATRPGRAKVRFSPRALEGRVYLMTSCCWTDFKNL